jgi:hypothetical protein
MKDVSLREMLDQLGVEYEVTTVSLASVDTEKNEYQTRQHSIVDGETVDRYVMSISAGAIFPEMLFAVSPGTRKSAARPLTPVTGRHRSVSLVKAGVESTTALVAYPSTDTQKAKLITLSRWDNFRNGKPETVHAHYMGLAGECISTAGGYANGMPPRNVVNDIASRNGLTQSQKQQLKRYVSALMFQAECRTLGISRIPDNVNLCSQAAAFLDHDRFESIAKAICANQDHKGLTKIVHECSQRNLRGEKAVEFLLDSTAGFSQPVHRMKTSDRACLQCNTLAALIVRMETDLSVTCADVEKLERAMQKAIDSYVAVSTKIKERACNG